MNALGNQASIGMSAPVSTTTSISSRRGMVAPCIIAALVFLATTLYTVYGTHSMSGGMPMPGGWTMSMMWMTMPGQSTAGAAIMFIAMWAAMMVAMMLPSAMPMILIYRRVTSSRGAGDATLRTWLMAGGYFAVWTILGAVVYAIGLCFMNAAMSHDFLSRAVPILGAICLIASGLYQCTPWKSACLMHCRDPLSAVACHLDDGKLGAIKMGFHHGAFCAACCWSLMLIQLVLGMMNLWVMAAIALVIALEKMLPRGIAIAKVVGSLAIAAGVWMLIRSFA
jgi:predicted metal-binding membrane protein